MMSYNKGGLTAFGYYFLVIDVMELGGPCTKDDVNQKFWTHLINVVDVAFARTSSIEVEIYGDMKSSRLFLLYHFKV